MWANFWASPDRTSEVRQQNAYMAGILKQLKVQYSEVAELLERCYARRKIWAGDACVVKWVGDALVSMGANAPGCVAMAMDPRVVNNIFGKATAMVLEARKPAVAEAALWDRAPGVETPWDGAKPRHKSV